MDNLDYITINKEFSDQFDVLYNNITSNQAPGLDEYEKSVFLTKAQDEIVKAYFNPKTNKVQEGFDGNEQRQIDFSMIIKSFEYRQMPCKLMIAQEGEEQVVLNSLPQVVSIMKNGAIPKDYAIDREAIQVTITEDKTSYQLITMNPFMSSCFDGRTTTKSVTLDNDILMFINEYIEVADNRENKRRLSVIPLNYMEYSRLMSKPFKRPNKYQAWRLLDNTNNYRKAELIVGPNDTIERYVIRYIKRPRAIVLDNFTDVSINGVKDAQCCELDPILFPEIIQRACELAKAAYMGDLQSQIILGQNSQTNMGIVAQSR